MNYYANRSSLVARTEEDAAMCWVNQGPFETEAEARTALVAMMFSEAESLKKYADSTAGSTASRLAERSVKLQKQAMQIAQGAESRVVDGLRFELRLY